MLPKRVRALLSAIGILVLAPKVLGEDTRPESIWVDALAAQISLDVEWGSEFQFEGISMRQLRYTGSRWQGRPQRVYAIYAHPVGEGPFPAILQIHGGGQTAYPANVAWFVRHGYACLSFDWTGPRDE